MSEKRDFFKDEPPELTLLINGGRELRFYSGAGRLTISRKSWKAPDGQIVIGKAINLTLKENKGNRDLIALLERVIEYLKEGV